MAGKPGGRQAGRQAGKGGEKTDRQERKGGFTGISKRGGGGRTRKFLVWGFQVPREGRHPGRRHQEASGGSSGGIRRHQERHQEASGGITLSVQEAG